jgi:2-polyprenyl-6-methoxyphenol hydroxylase-like FAD-dependent oxidoreductase
MMRVAVIGAGIGGLCAATGLQQAGAEVRVFERATELRPVGSGLSVFPNGISALEALGLGREFAQITASDAAGLQAGQRRPDGSWLARLPHDAVGGLRIVHRADLHRMLVAALEPGSLHLGTTVSAVRSAGTSVEYLEAPGTRSSEVFDVVVAADGINSAIRRSWPGDPGVRYSGYASWRGVTSRPVDLLGAAGETWGRGLRFGMAPLRDGRVYWFAVASVPADETAADEYARVWELFGGWHPPIPALLDATDPAVVFRLPINDLAKPLSSFRRDRCVLLGDAAHAMTPDLGQGANQAMEDAATLAALLEPFANQSEPPADAVIAALASYDRRRRARTQPIARRARALGAVAHVRSRAGVALRDSLLRFTPSSVLSKQTRSVQTWAPPVVAPHRSVGPGVQ